MKKPSLLLAFLLIALSSWSQQGILLTNSNTNQEILLKEGDLVKFSYKGYLGQREIKSGIIFSIQDSIVEVVSPANFSKTGTTKMETRIIRIQDLTGFRKFHKSRPYLMTLSSITITVGSILLFYSIDKTTDLSFGEKFGISLATGMASTLIVKGLFPERIKNKIGEEWKLKVLK